MLVFCCLLIVSVLLNAHCYVKLHANWWFASSWKACRAPLPLSRVLSVDQFESSSSSLFSCSFDLLRSFVSVGLLQCWGHTHTITHSHTCHITTRNKHDLKIFRVKGLLFIIQGPLIYCFDLLVGFVLKLFFQLVVGFRICQIRTL